MKGNFTDFSFLINTNKVADELIKIFVAGSIGKEKTQCCIEEGHLRKWPLYTQIIKGREYYLWRSKLKGIQWALITQ